MPTNNSRQAAWVAIGSAFSYGIALVSSMILSRYFSKADYGTYQQVMYVYHTLLTLFTLGLPRAFSYFLPRVPDNQAKDLISKLTLLFLFLGLLFSLVLFVFSPFIAHILKNPDLTQALRLFAVVPTLLLPTLGLDGILATYKKTQFLAYYKSATSLLTLFCVAFPVMFLGLGYMEAIKGFIIGSALQCILAIILKHLPVHSYQRDRCTVSFKEIFLFSFPLLQASIWGLLISSTDQYFISHYYGKEVFAEFSNGSIELPFVPMVVGACATVLSPIFSRLSHEQVDFNKQVYPIWKSVFEKTAKLIYPILIYCIVFSVPLMEVLYGKQYSASGTYFGIKMFVNFFNIIAFAPLLINAGKVKLYSNAHAITALAIIVIEYICAHVFSSPYAIAITSMSCNIVKIILMLVVIARMFMVRLIDLFPARTLSFIIIPSFVFLLLVSYVLKQVLHWDGLLLLIVSFVAYCLFYFIHSKIAHIDYSTVFKPLFHK